MGKAVLICRATELITAVYLTKIPYCVTGLHATWGIVIWRRRLSYNSVPLMKK